ncbi:MAG: hypothetical protein K6U08_02290 [Firmicutes bacterium]|nr:hypothetical protein [Bacillota bacterium]
MSQAPAAPEAEGLPSGRRTARPGGSFLEVRVGQGRLDIVEFYSAGRSPRLVEILRRLGLAAERDFDSPCG